MDDVQKRRVAGLMKWATKKDLGLIIECLCYEQVLSTYKGSQTARLPYWTPELLCDGFGLFNVDAIDGNNTAFVGMTPIQAIIHALPMYNSWGEFVGAVIGAVGLWDQGDRDQVLPALREAMAYVAENGCDS